MYTFVHFRFLEREQSAFCHYGYSMKQHTPKGGRKQQQHDNTANLVSQFIIEEKLEREAKSYLEEEQQSSQLSLPFDIKIQSINITCHKKVKGSS